MSAPFGMSCRGVIGKVTEKRVEVCFEWTIPDLSFLTASPSEYFDSPPFSVSSCSWYLRLYPYSRENSDWISLYLRKEDSGDDKNVTCILGVRNKDDTTEIAMSTETFTRHQSCYGRSKFLARSSLSDSVTLTCRIKDNQSPTIEVAPQQVRLAELETLSSNFRDLYTSKIGSDVTIRVRNRQFQVHRAVLVVRSRVFAAMFDHGMSEDETGVVTIEDCDDPESFDGFLEYLYTGKIGREMLFGNALQLYVTADKYDVRELKSFCIAYIMHNLSVENVCSVVIMAERYDDAGLMSAAQIFFNGNVAKILSTCQWEELLRENHLLANRLLKDMASKIKSQN